MPEGSIGIQLLDAPAVRADDPRAQVYIIDHVGPGTSFSRRIQVTSGLEEPREFALDVVAADIEDGQFTVRDDAHTPLMDWITLDSETLTLGTQESAIVRVAVDVPADAPEGEHYGAVLAGVSNLSDQGVGAVSRVGVRIYLSVGEGGEPAPNFSIVDMTASRTPDGSPAVEVRVENSGGRALDLSGELTLSDGPGGTKAGPFNFPQGPTIAPGQFATMVMGPLPDDLPAGPWTARAVLRSGLLERAAEATITFPDAAGTSAEPVEATEVPLHQDRGFLVPLALGLLLLALLLVVLVWYLRRRRADEDDGAGADAEAADATP